MKRVQDLTSFDEIVKFVKACYNIEDKLQDEIINMGTLLFNPRKDELRERKRKIKKNLNEIRDNMEWCRKQIYEFTTFEKDLFLPFMKDYLSLVEKEKYELMLNIEEMDFAMALATKTYPLNLFGDNYNIITTQENRELLIDSKDSWGLADVDDIDDFLDNISDGKYICLEDEDYYTLIDGYSLAEEFENYPYLFDLGKKIVNMRLMDPSLSDSEVLDSILNDLRKRIDTVNKNRNKIREFKMPTLK